MEKMPLPSAVTFIIERLGSHGYAAHAVGGCVRDFLLGREIGDYDLTTSATPEQMKEVFSDCRTIDTGIKHGTVSVCIDRVPYEVTTYRTDGEYKDNRHPETVSFTSSLAEDLARRDFTVNAICYNPKDGYTDLFGGREDLSRGLIRAVGEPHRRFGEDALRIMRAVRFSATLGFSIEEKTAAAVHELRHLLSNIAPERIHTELKKLMAGEGAYGVLAEYGDVIAVFLPELRCMKLPERALFDRADMASRILSLFYLSCDSPASAYGDAMRRLRCDNLTRIHGEKVLSALDGLDLGDVRGALLSLMKHGEDTVRGALRLGELLGRYGQTEAAVLDSALSSGIPYELSGLDLRGGDVSSLGYYGCKVGERLDFLLRAVIEGKCENDRAALIAYLTQNR